MHILRARVCARVQGQPHRSGGSVVERLRRASLTASSASSMSSGAGKDNDEDDICPVCLDDAPNLLVSGRPVLLTYPPHTPHAYTPPTHHSHHYHPQYCGTACITKVRTCGGSCRRVHGRCSLKGA